MALIPENRMEQILAGENITPESREEAFVKEAIDNAGSGGGSDLPEPGNAGNVLTSTGDGWESDELPKDTVYATITLGETITCDKSVADLIAAVEAHKTVVGTAYDGERYLVAYVEEHSATRIKFVCTERMSLLKLSVFEITGAAQDPDVWSIEGNTSAYRTLPAVTEDDNGKVLGAVSGGYDWVNKNPIFDFTVEADAQNPGQYICTPGTGTSFAAITAALSETPNVYARFAIPGDSSSVTARFDEVGGDTACNATGLIFAGTNFMAYRLRIATTDECAFAIRQLANQA